MVAVDVELYAGVFLAADHHVEYRPAVHLRQIGGGAVGGMVQAEGEDGMLQPGHRSMALALSALTMTDPAGGTSSANRRKECWMSADP